MRAVLWGTLALLALTGSAFADEYVQGYCKQDGRCVDGYWRSSPDGDPSNNWSTKGNQNPYTGKWGTHEPKEEGDPLSTPYGPYSPPAPSPGPWSDGQPQGG